MANIRKFGNRAKRPIYRAATFPYEKLLMLNAASKGLWELGPGVPNPFGNGDGGTELQYKVGSFNKTTNTSVPVDQAVTGIGFQPKAVILFFHAVPVGDDTVTPHTQWNMGFSDGTNHKSIYSGSWNAQTTMNTSRAMSSTKVLAARNVASEAIVISCDVKSFDSDGFTLTFDVNDPNSDPVKYIAIGGDIISDTAVGKLTSPISTTGVQAINAGINNGDFLLLISAGTTTEDINISHGMKMIGVAASASEQGVSLNRARDAVGTSDTVKYQRTNKVAALVNTTANTVVEEGAFNGFTTTGFEIDWTISDANANDYYYLLIKGGSWSVKSDTMPTSISKKTYTTDNHAKALMMMGVTGITAGTPQAATESMHFGGHDGDTGACLTTLDENAQASADCDSMVTADVSASGTLSPTMLQRAHVDFFNENDMILDHTVKDATAQEFIYVTGSDDVTVTPLALYDNCLIHCDAALGITLSGSEVTNWASNERGKHDLVAALPLQQPVWNSTDADFNGLPSLTFNGDFLENVDYGIYPQPLTLWTIFKLEDLTLSKFYWDGERLANRHSCHSTTGNKFNVFAPTSVAGGTMQTSTAIIFTTIYNGASSRFYIDGALIASGNMGTNASRGLALGSTYNAASGGHLKFGEVALYGELQSVSDLNTIGALLQAKFNTAAWTTIV